MKRSFWKRGISLLLTLSFLTCFAPALPSLAAGDPEGQPVSTPEEFEAMRENGTYYLANDIDFSGRGYTRNLYAKTFRGVLDGNGHALLGITVTSTQSDAGIFGNNFAGTLKNLTIGSAASPAVVRSTGAGYSVACVAGTMASGALFDNVTLYCHVSGEGKTAGFTSYIGGGTLSIGNSRVYGSITGNPAAGFVTLSPDGSCTLTIKNCANFATVTGGNLSAGGLYTASASTNSSRVCHLTMTGCANFGDVTASDWRVGGIVGEFNEEKSSTLSLAYCYNRGTIRQTGSGGHAAGIVGGMSFNAPSGKRSVSRVYNAGEVVNTGNPSAAYAIAFANSATTNSSVSDACFLAGTGASDEAPTANVALSGVSALPDRAAMTAAVLAFGEGPEGIAFIADSAEGGDGWPLLSWQRVSHEHVTTYDCGRRVCEDCGQILSDPEEEHHTMIETVTPPTATADGYRRSVCRFCGESVLTAGEPSPAHLDPVDGVYTLTQPEHLFWYASSVANGLLPGREQLVLGADLDLSGRAFAPIPFFGGSLDGRFHTIRGLSVNAEGDAGLFALLTSGAVVKNLAFETAAVTSSAANAGVLAGALRGGALVEIKAVLVGASTVTAAKAAGGLLGSTDGAAGCSVSTVVVSGCRLSGRSAGGVVGLGNSAQLFNCHACNELTGDKRNPLAYSTGGASLSYCYYVRKGGTAPGATVLEEADFAAGGKVWYLVNTLAGYGFGASIGTEEGKPAFGGARTYLVRSGAGERYTSRALAAEGTFAAYRFGDFLVIAVRKNADKRFVDAKITVGERALTYADFTLSRYLLAEGETYVPAEGFVLYVMPFTGPADTRVVVE